jgi:pilus assembly protein CpaC
MIRFTLLQEENTMKKFLLLWAVLAIAMLPALIASAGEEIKESLTLRVGEQKVYSGANISKVSPGDQRIASVVTSEDQNQIIVKAMAKGQTNLVMFAKDGNKITVAITVVALDPSKVIAELQDALKDIEGIKIRMVGEDKVVIDGQVFTEKDLKRCEKVAAWYGDMVKLLVEFNDAYIPMKENIDVEFNLVEMNKKALGSVGVNWDDLLAVSASTALTALTSGGGLVGQVGISSTFGTAINIMVGDGTAKILKKNDVIVQSGQEGKWFAGGTFYVRNITQNTSTVQGIDYGTGITVTPKIDRLKNMLIKVDAEISELDASNVVDGIPGLTKRKLTTQVTMKEADTLLLAGVISRVSGEDIQKVPGLGSIPILGWLFKSKSYQTGVTDAIIFVTPKIISAESETSNKRIESMQGSYDKKK